MSSVTEGLVLGLSAHTDPCRLLVSRELLRLEGSALMRPITERLIFGKAACAVPIILSGLDLDSA